MQLKEPREKETRRKRGNKDEIKKEQKGNKKGTVSPFPNTSSGEVL